MAVLGLDSSTNFVSLGLISDQETLGELTFHGVRRQVGKLIPWLDCLLKEAQISLKEIACLACVSGPGSFTGLRISLATIQGLALSLTRPVVDLCSLDVFAHSAPYGKVSVLVHSQSDSYFYARYEDGRRQGHIGIAPLAKIIAELPDSTTLVSPYAERIRRAWSGKILPVAVSGAQVAKMGELQWKEGRLSDPLSLIPTYLRGSSAEEKKHVRKPLP